MFGGVAPGGECLSEMIENIREVLNTNINKLITTRTIVDIFNIIGVCVVSGNIRRGSEIALGDYNDEEFINLKNYTLNPDRIKYGWLSNNSIYSNFGMDYSAITPNIITNGEPGFVWLPNMQEYGRMGDEPNNLDYRANGCNPCSEQTLESYELCCLVELFPSKHNDLEDFKKTIKYAFMYAKTVTLCRTHWKETNAIIMRNRRIGCSLTGISNFLASHSIEDLKQWCNTGYNVIKYYDKVYSEWFCIPGSIKVTSIKPSGTISLLANVAPGLHPPIANFYIRRVRISNTSEYLNKFIMQVTM